MELLENVGRILAGWIVCSVVVAAAWSRVITMQRNKEQRAGASMLNGEYGPIERRPNRQEDAA